MDWLLKAIRTGLRTAAMIGSWWATSRGRAWWTSGRYRRAQLNCATSPLSASPVAPLPASTSSWIPVRQLSKDKQRIADIRDPCHQSAM